MSAVPEREHAHTYGLSCPADGCRWPSPSQPLMPGGESIAAQLRRVTDELNELKATVDRMAADHIRLLKRNVRAEQELGTQAQSLSEQLKMRLAAEAALEEAEQQRDAVLNDREAVLAERNAARCEVEGVRASLAEQAADAEDARATLAVRDRQLRDARAELDLLRTQLQQLQQGES